MGSPATRAPQQPGRSTPMPEYLWYLLQLPLMPFAILLAILTIRP